MAAVRDGRSVDADHDSLSPFVEDGERISAAVAGELLGPAVARALDVPDGRIVGPEPSVVIVVTAERVLAIRRHPGGRIDRVVWAAARSALGPVDDRADHLVLGSVGEMIVVRSAARTGMQRLLAAITVD